VIEPRELKDRPVTREQVLAAIEQFKLDPPKGDWLANKTQHWVFMHEGDPYPPKRILSIATTFPVMSFHTDAALPVLRALGFKVLGKNAYLGRKAESDPPSADLAGATPNG
jgi:hypothetical protein